MRAPDSQSAKASMHDVLDADKTSWYRSAAARLNFWAGDRPDIQYAVRVCSKSMSSPRVTSVWQDTLVVQSDGGRAGDKSTRKRNNSLRSASASQLEQRPDRYRDEHWRSRAVRCMYGGTASHGNGEHCPRVGSASRRHGAASGRQLGHWNRRQAGIGKN